MPEIHAIIRRAWVPRGEVGRIHYIARSGVEGSGDRHLVVDAGDPLYDVLADALAATGYPASRPSRPGRTPALPSPELPSDDLDRGRFGRPRRVAGGGAIGGPLGSADSAGPPSA